MTSSELTSDTVRRRRRPVDPAGWGADLVVGVDIGGSKTHVVVSHLSGHPVNEFLTNGANLAALGATECARRLRAAFDQIDCGRVAAVCAGAAGADSPSAVATLEHLIGALVPRVPVRVVHDTELVLATAGAPAGIVVIAGTGSVVWGRATDGRTARTGGWGYLLGDEGSGYWIGRAAVRHTLARDDDGSPPDALARALLADCDVLVPQELLGHFYATADRRYWAARSRLVVALAERADPAAVAIVDEAAAALSSLVCQVDRRLGGGLPVVLAGGVLVHQPAVRSRLAALLPGDVPLHVLTEDPVHGAVALARRDAGVDVLR